MKYSISKPSPFLSQYVKYYWNLENCMSIGEEHIQRIVPNGLFELIFYLQDKPVASESSKTISDRIVLTGQLKNYHDISVTGDLSLFAIYFLPHGLSMFLDIPIRELFDLSVPLKDILKGKVDKLEEDLFESVTFQEKIKVAETFLAVQIRKSEKKYKYDRIRHTINKINKARGVLEINELAEESFLSRKQFERSFSEVVGASPKQFLKIVRFQNAIYEKTMNPEMSLTELAFKCGYYDQAHLINDFKTLSGITPKKYFEDGDVISDYFDLE